MARILDYIGSSFQKNPTFPDFILSAQRCKPHSALILNRKGRLEKLGPHNHDTERLRKTWNAFRQAVHQSFSPKRIEQICARYQFDLDHTDDTHPLETRYIEFFGVGAIPYTFSLQEYLPFFISLPWPYKFPYKMQKYLPEFLTLRGQTPEEIHRLYEEASQMRYLGKVKDPTEVHGGVEDTHEHFRRDLWRMDRRRANLFRGIEEMGSKDPKIPWDHPYYSRLAMGVISHLETKEEDEEKIDGPDVELVIPALGNAEGKLEYYKVYKIISRGGLTAVALTPISKYSKLDPILAFRCTQQALTQTNAVESLYNDLEKAMGEPGYKASRAELEELMKDQAFTQGKKINVLAYSLGGAQAGYFMEKYWPQVKEFVGFNFVGNKAEVIESLASQINQLPSDEIPPHFYIYRNIGDWVNKSGEKHVGWGISHPNAIIQVIEWDLKKDYPFPTSDIWDPIQRERWGKLHAARPMDCEPEEKMRGKFGYPWRYKYHFYVGPKLCNEILDTYKRDGSLEDLRRKTAEFLSIVLRWSYAILDFVFRNLGIEFFRKNFSRIDEDEQ